MIVDESGQTADECADVELTPTGYTGACDRVARSRHFGTNVRNGDILSSHYCVSWRYITSDGKYVLVKDKNITAGQATWVFIKRSAFTDGDLPLETDGDRHDSCARYSSENP